MCTPKQTHAQTNACTAAYVCAQTAHACICFGQALATSSRSRSVVVSYCCCCRAARRALTSATSSSGESSSVAEGAARHPGLATQIDSQNGIQDAGQHKNHPKTKMEENANGGTTSCRRGGHPDVIYSDVFLLMSFFPGAIFLVGIFQKVVEMHSIARAPGTSSEPSLVSRVSVSRKLRCLRVREACQCIMT